jgi:ATP-dependent exoDNAse (exonuclease V) beta subunit
VADPLASRVQVMTIHQSKGLEFDAVVLPELDGKACELAGKSGQVAYERNRPTGKVTRISRWMSEKVRAVYPSEACIDELFDRHRVRNVRESLCLLYVAMTRARQGLYMFMDPPADNERTFPKRLSSVLRSALATGKVEPDSVVHQAGDAGWIRSFASRSPLQATSAGDGTTTIKLDRQLSERDLVLLRSHTAAAASTHAEAFAGVEQLGGDRESRDRGTAIHALCESLEWLGDSAADDAALETILRNKLPRRDENWAREQVKTFRTLLQQPAIRDLFTKPENEQLIVHRELPFARVVDGQLQRGYIDRVTLKLDSDGNAVEACVIDFKTNSLRNITPDAAAQTYRPQLQTYREAVLHVFQLPADRIGMRVAFVAAGEVVELSCD